MEYSFLLTILKVLLIFGIVYAIIKHLKFILIILVVAFLFLLIQGYFDINILNILKQLFISH